MKKCMYICLDDGGYNHFFTTGNKVYSGYRVGKSEMIVNTGVHLNYSINTFLDTGIKLHMIYDEEGNYVGGDLNPLELIPRRVRWTF